MAEAVGAGGDAGGGEAGGETSGGGKGLADRGKLKAKTARAKRMQSAEMDAQVCTMVSVSVCVCAVRVSQPRLTPSWRRVPVSMNVCVDECLSMNVCR